MSTALSGRGGGPKVQHTYSKTDELTREIVKSAINHWVNEFTMLRGVIITEGRISNGKENPAYKMLINADKQLQSWVKEYVAWGMVEGGVNDGTIVNAEEQKAEMKAIREGRYIRGTNNE